MQVSQVIDILVDEIGMFGAGFLVRHAVHLHVYLIAAVKQQITGNNEQVTEEDLVSYLCVLPSRPAYKQGLPLFSVTYYLFSIP